MVLVKRLSKVSHLITVNYTNLASELAEIFIKEIMRLNGVSKRIILDREDKFTSKFCKEIFTSFGTHLSFSTTYNPQTNGNIERMNRILEDMLRMYVMHQQRNW